MGIAVFIPGIKFPETNGKVTLAGDTPPASLQIISENSYTDFEAQLSVEYSPINTSLRGIAWSIVSGGEYATIDNYGRLSIKQGASSSSVVVKVASTADSSVFATKEITVTYDNAVTILTKVNVSGNPTINTRQRLFDENDSIEMKYKLTDAVQGHVSMLWGCLSEQSSAYIDSMRQINVTMGSDVEHSTVIGSGEMHIYKTPTMIGTEYVDEYFIDRLVRNNEEINYSGGQTAIGFTPSQDIYILSPNYNYSFMGIDVCYLKFKRSGVVTHNFAAAEKNGVYGFYDSYSDTFITNTGLTGTITL